MAPLFNYEKGTMNNFYTNIQVIGDEMLVRAIVDGKKENYREEFYPTLFCPTKNQTKFKTLDGKSVDKIQPGTITECRDEVRKWKKAYNINLYGSTDWVCQYIGKEFDKCKYDMSKVRVMNIDIECGSESGFPTVREAKEELVAITFKDSETGKFVTLGCGKYVNTRDDVFYVKCADEVSLIRRFIEIYKTIEPDVITGWNTKWFDMPYLIRRINNVLGESESKFLSPWGLVKEKIDKWMGREHIIYHISGVSQLDYFLLYKKFTYVNQARYTLDHIADVELGEGKLSYKEHGNLHNLYKEDYQKFIDYNLKDVELVDKLDDKLKLIDLTCTMAYDSGTNYEDVLGQTRFWDAYIYHHLRRKNIVIPPKRVVEKKERVYEGAYVKDPIIGLHDWVVSFDLNSLYPHLIMQYNISPETFLKDVPRFFVDDEELMKGETSLTEYPDACMAGNGYFFSTKEKGFLPELMEEMYNDRVKYKDLMFDAIKSGDKDKIAQYNTIQMAKKISLNSAYGAIGSEYFRYYDLRQAEAITKSGQLAIRWIERKMNDYLNNILETEDEDYVIASDTDSIYVTLGSLIEKVVSDASTDKIVDFIDTICNDKIEPYIDKSFEELAEYMNSYRQKMIMKREVIAEKGIWTSKKRYVLNVWDNEGVRNEEPKIKIMGIEAVRSSTPQSCRDKILESMKIILNGDEDELIEYIEEFKKNFKDLPAEEISFPRTVSGLKKYFDSVHGYIKGTPIQVKGSLIYNQILSDKKLSMVYESIKEGEKIKYTYLKEPNPTRDKVIAFVNTLPEEFGLDKYIDYDLQFEKSYIDPIKTVTNAIGWNHERISTLETFFA